MSLMSKLSLGLFTTLFCASSALKQATPTQKVIGLLKKFQADITEEATREAAEFKEFTKFCDKSKNEKTYQIGRSEKEIDGMSADIGVLTQDIKLLTEELEALAKDTASFEGQLQAATDTRAEEARNYSARAKTMTDSIAALERAMEVMKASKGSQAGLAQLRATAADVLSSARQVSLLQLTSEDVDTLGALTDATGPAGVGSVDIVAMLRGLKTTFVKNKHDLDTEEENNKFTFNKVQANMTKLLKFAQEDKTEKTSTKVEKEGKKAELEKDLAAENASLLADKSFLEELGTTCLDKAAAAEERKTMRDGELKALSTAIAQLGESPSLIQAKKQMSIRKHSHQTDMSLKKHTAAKVPASGPRRASFLQLRGGLASVSGQKSKIAKLEEMAARVNMSLFSLAVLKVKASNSTSADPYAEIRRVIKNLVTSMENTTATAASVKTQCDSIAATNNKDKAESQKEIDELLAEIDGTEAFVSKTSEQVGEFEKDISELKENLAEAEKLRADEKASNEAAIQEASRGEKAATDARSTLQAYYASSPGSSSSSSKSNAGFLQVSQPQVKTADYAGEAAQRSSGVLGMLDVVISDFQSAKSKTEDEEKKAAADHEKFKADSNSDLASKETELSTKKAEINQKQAKLLADKGALETQQEINLKAKQALEESKAMCAQDSYEAQKEARDANIASLKQILSDLEDMIAAAASR
eukprot:TRINITY_DN2198_c0_g2_i1.p1 TRINITY_DN2198_c0_g2~~TRINITY_DN2198_c0_g2_i1.p1  ORF type:complete len:703 (-),score=215.23 TRINITY_DN2198_c0_g2_i1:8-2116(-)